MPDGEASDDWGASLSTDARSAGFNPFDDPRDWQFEEELFPPRSRGQGEAIWLTHPWPVRNQNHVDCCVSCSLVTCMEILDAMRPPAEPLSVLYHYFQARRLAGMRPDNLGGLDLQTGFRAIQRFGVCRQSRHAAPISPGNARRTPNNQAHSDAADHRLARDRQGRWAYRHLPVGGLTKTIKRTLIARRPVAFGFWLSPGYWQLEEDTNGVYRPLGQLERRAHVATILGFHNKKRTPGASGPGAFLLKDSRGRKFGKEGYWWLPYRLMRSRMVRQCWTIDAVGY